MEFSSLLLDNGASVELVAANVEALYGGSATCQVLVKHPSPNDYQAECHTPEYHIGIDLIKPCQNPVRMRYSGVWHSADNRLNTT